MRSDIMPKHKEKATSLLAADHISVGVATCGLSAGAKPVLDGLKKAKLGIPVLGVGCVGMCYNEPIVTVKQNGKQSVYSKVTEDQLPEFIAAIKRGEIYTPLFLCHDVSQLEYYKKQERVVLRDCGVIDPLKIDHYLAVGGFDALHSALKLKPLKVIDEVERAGLRGRGGGGFPTARKWRFIAEKKGKKFIVCNGDEGDPGAFMNRTLMESDPFRIIEGLIIGAYATGAREGVIYTRAEYPLAITMLQNAIDVCEKHGLLGKDILGKKGFDFSLRIMQGAGAYVCGEETALIQSVEGFRGHPMPRPPYPAVSGLYALPTVVNNIGTWGHVTAIFRDGCKEYCKHGSKFSKGTKILCLSGKVNRTGVIEVPFGISLRDIIYSIGGGMPKGTRFKALFPGGPAGGCITAKNLSVSLDYESMRDLKTIMGSGSFIVTNNQDCMVNMAKFFLTFTTQESCGKCVPCREGTKRLLELLTSISRGVAALSDIDKVEKLATMVHKTSLCGLGQFAPNPVLSTIREFRNEYETHITKKHCPAHVCENLLTYEIVKKDCVGCGNCARHCPVHCISGELKKPFVIDQSKCIKCGACFDNCAFDAIVRD